MNDPDYFINLTPIDPTTLMAGSIPADAFMTTWDTLGTVAGISCGLGVVTGVVTLYVAQQVRIHLNGELSKREPHAQRSNHPQPRHADPDDEEELEATV